MSSSNVVQPQSVSQVITTLVPLVAIASCAVTAFLILRQKRLRIYQPRTFLSSLRPQERTPASSAPGLLGWMKDYLALPDTYVLNHQSMDAYFLLRFLRIASLITFVGCCMLWPILWPVYATGGGGYTQFETLSFTNIAQSDKNRPFATVFMAWLFFGFVWYMVAREQVYYINLRQAYLLSPLYANRISARTVMYNSVPLNYCEEGIIRQLFKATPPKNVWISTDCKELSDLVDQRTKTALKLEAAETKLIKLANDNRLKAYKKNPQSMEEEQAVAAADIDGESGSAAGRWVDPKKRPTHRLKPLIGKKVDTINWCREEIARLTPQIEKLQAEHRNGSAKAVGSVFVEFGSQAEAQAAYQSTTHHQALQMTPRSIGMNPDEVIWSNLRIKWWERLVRKLGTRSFIVALLLFWAIPVALVGLLSNIYNLLPQSCSPMGNGPAFMVWLCFITKLPNVLFGLIQGLLPSVLLAVLMALVPIILRKMSKLGGAPTLSAVELSCQSSYFAFQVIEVFLVATLGSAASSVATSIGANPGSTPTLLAAKIPTAANLYMCYIIVQAIGTFYGSLLQAVGLILFTVLGKFLDNTPRKIYKRWTTLPAVKWGSTFPIYELFLVICIIYSCLSPLLLGWSTIGLYLLYQAYRYNFFFVYNATTIDTKGLVYPTALNHITVGLYIAEVTYIGIFAVQLTPGPAVLMAIFTVASVLFHISLKKALNPLLYTLPTSLTIEEERLRGLENGNSGSMDKGAVVDKSTSNGSENGALTHSTALPAPHKKPNFFTKWLRPDKFADYETMRRLVPTDFANISYPAEIERNAYFDPCIGDEAPILWIPRDQMGISKQEIAHTSKVIPISDEDASFDDKGKLHWDQHTLPPVHQEKIYY